MLSINQLQHWNLVYLHLTHFDLPMPKTCYFFINFKESTRGVLSCKPMTLQKPTVLDIYNIMYVKELRVYNNNIQ